MIIEAFFTLIIDTISFLINMLPTPVFTVISNIEIPIAIKHGAYFFPVDCLVVAITSFLSWYGTLITWSCVEWVYKKIPGVD